jgi:hypothetical protein
MPAPFTKNWDCRAAPFACWGLALSFLLPPRVAMMTMVSRLKRRRNKVGLGKPTDGREGMAEHVSLGQVVQGSVVGRKDWSPVLSCSNEMGLRRVGSRQGHKNTVQEWWESAKRGSLATKYSCHGLPVDPISRHWRNSLGKYGPVAIQAQGCGEMGSGDMCCWEGGCCVFLPLVACK